MASTAKQRERRSATIATIPIRCNALFIVAQPDEPGRDLHDDNVTCRQAIELSWDGTVGDAISFLFSRGSVERPARSSRSGHETAASGEQRRGDDTEDTVFVVRPRVKDTDPDGGLVTIIGATATNGARERGWAERTWCSTPVAAFTGTRDREYTISDGGGTTKASSREVHHHVRR